jgi:hypothetical protein
VHIRSLLPAISSFASRAANQAAAVGGEPSTALRTDIRAASINTNGPQPFLHFLRQRFLPCSHPAQWRILYDVPTPRAKEKDRLIEPTAFPPVAAYPVTVVLPVVTTVAEPGVVGSLWE